MDSVDNFSSAISTHSTYSTQVVDSEDSLSRLVTQTVEGDRQDVVDSVDSLSQLVTQTVEEDNQVSVCQLPSIEAFILPLVSSRSLKSRDNQQ